MRRVGSIALALTGGFLCLSSCAGKPDVSIELLDACVGSTGLSFREGGAYTEFVVFRNGCPPDAQLAAGDTQGAVFKRTVAADAGLPTVGDLDKIKYGFAALVRNQSCGVVGFGCTEANMDNVRTVRIAVCDWSAETADGKPTCGCQLLSGAGCPAPLTCNKGRCESTGDCVVEDEPGCDLSLVASGPLLATDSSTVVAGGPGITPTPDGFVIGYREGSSTGAAGHVKLMGLTDCGQLVQSAHVDLAAAGLACAGGGSDDGVGVAFSSGAGLAAASLPNCGSGGGVLLMPFDAKGALHAKAAGPRNAAFHKLRMASPTGSVAPSSSATDFELVYRIENDSGGGELQRVVLSAPAGEAGPEFKGVPVQFPLGNEDILFGRVVSSTQVRAFAGSIPSKAGVVLALGPNSADTLDTRGEVQLPDANWTASTAWADKAAAMVPAATGVTWKAAQLAGATVAEIATGTVGSGSVQGGGMAVLGNNLMILTATSQGMTVHRVTGAQGTLGTSASDSVPIPLGAGALTGFDGQRVAVAAARTRVAVAWVNAAQVSSGTVGGWALLKCAQ